MMTPKQIAESAERMASNQPMDDDWKILAFAYVAEKRERDLVFRVNEMASIERAVMDPPNGPACWPDWVYEARRAVRMMRSENPSWFEELLSVLGWQSGTIHQALNAVRRLVEADKEKRKAKQ